MSVVGEGRRGARERDYISLLIIPCIIYHVTNKETLNLEESLHCTALSG